MSKPGSIARRAVAVCAAAALSFLTPSPSSSQDGRALDEAHQRLLLFAPPARGAGVVETDFAVTLPSPASGVWQEAMPLPVYDDFGELITRAEIEDRMRSGKGAGILGGVAGAVAGLYIGLLIADAICEVFYFYPLPPEPCSPREEALQEVAAWGSLAWGITGGFLIGDRLRGIDRWEALEKIRAERRAARRGEVR